MQARPKRGAAQRANYVINYITLNYKEEQDLRKAIQASLSEAKTSRKSNIASSQSGANCTVTNESKKSDEKSTKSGKNNTCQPPGPIVSPVLASVVKKRPPSPKSSKDLNDSTSNATSYSAAVEKKKPKIPSQRKFAQNSASLGSSTNTTPVKFGPFTPLIPTNEIFPAIKPATEDFLTFLCLRKTSLLPRKLNMFALNEEAMKSKKMDKPLTSKIIQTPIKQEAVQSTSSSSSSNNTKSRLKFIESKNLPAPTSSKITIKSEEKPLKNQASSKPATKNNSIKSTGKSDVKKAPTNTSSTSTSNATSNVKFNKSVVNNVSSSKEKKMSQTTSTITKSQANSKFEPQKRITRSTSVVNDDNSTKIQLTKQSKPKPKPKANNDKPTNVAAKKILKNAVTSKKKSTQSHISTPRGFVLDRVTRSIKHLRSMEEVR